jgi:hypothetical protein
VSYEELAARLGGASRKAVNTKTLRGVFTAAWFARALSALGADNVRISD